MQLAEKLSPVNKPGQHANSGLPRWLGFVGVLVFSLASIGLPRSSNFPLELIPGRWPGINLVLVIGIALGVGLIFTLTFSAIGAVIRRPAADYVIASRLIHPAPAFASSFTFLVTLSLFAGSIAGSIAKQFLPNLFKTIGTVFSSQDILLLADSAASTQIAILVGTAAIVLSFVLLAFPPKTVLWLMRAGVIFALICWIILLLQLGFPQENTFTIGYERVFGSGTYLQHIELAYQYGLATNPPGLDFVILIGLFCGFYLFFGAALPMEVAGEVKQPEKKLLPASVCALLMAGGLILATIGLLGKVVPAQFISAQSYLTQQQIEIAGLSLSWLPFYAAISKPVLLLVVVVGICWILLLFLLVQAFMIVISRIVLAWAKDRVIPEKLAYIHPRQQTPLLAVMVAALAMQIGLIDAVLGGTIYSMLHFAIFLSISQILPVAALILYPILGKNVEGKIHIGRVSALFASLLGLATLSYLIWTIVAIFIYPFQFQELRLETLPMLVICFIIGLLWYLVRSYYLRRKGISLADSYRSMPPEG